MVDEVRGIERKFIELIGERLAIDDLSTINLDSRFDEDLGADSIDRHDIVFEAFKAYGLNINSQLTMQFKTVSQLWDYVDSHRKPY